MCKCVQDGSHSASWSRLAFSGRSPRALNWSRYPARNLARPRCLDGEGSAHCGKALGRRLAAVAVLLPPFSNQRDPNPIEDVSRGVHPRHRLRCSASKCCSTGSLLRRCPVAASKRVGGWGRTLCGRGRQWPSTTDRRADRQRGDPGVSAELPLRWNVGMCLQLKLHERTEIPPERRLS
jgi:hypothetical protein